MGKLVILRDCEEHLVMFCGAQEQPVPKVCLENYKNAEIPGEAGKALWRNLAQPFAENRALGYVIQKQ